MTVSWYVLLSARTPNRSPRLASSSSIVATAWLLSATRVRRGCFAEQGSLQAGSGPCLDDLLTQRRPFGPCQRSTLTGRTQRIRVAITALIMAGVIEPCKDFLLVAGRLTARRRQDLLPPERAVHVQPYQASPAMEPHQIGHRASGWQTTPVGQAQFPAVFLR